MSNRINDFRNLLLLIVDMIKSDNKFDHFFGVWDMDKTFLYSNDFDLEQVKIIETDLFDLMQYFPLEYFRNEDNFDIIEETIDEINNYIKKYNSEWITITDRTYWTFANKRNEDILKIIINSIFIWYCLVEKNKK